MVSQELLGTAQHAGGELWPNIIMQYLSPGRFMEDVTEGATKVSKCPPLTEAMASFATSEWPPKLKSGSLPFPAMHGILRTSHRFSGSGSGIRAVTHFPLQLGTFSILQHYRRLERAYHMDKEKYREKG